MLKKLEDNSVHSVVTDPPAGISFMGKSWDDDKGGRDNWIKWLTDVMIEVRRVLKPGGHALVWALPRTSHWTACAVENAGFEIRDVVVHLFGCGYPKGQDISKLIDKRSGQERQVVGHKAGTRQVGTRKDGKPLSTKGWAPGTKQEKIVMEITGATTAEAKKWVGWSTALKPSNEHWILARKPLVFETLAENVKRCEAGALNIDECRIPIVGEKPPEFKFSETADHGTGNSFHMGSTTIDKVRGMTWQAHEKGRWPANTIMSHAEGCVKTGETSTIKANTGGENFQVKNRTEGFASLKPGRVLPDDVVDLWECADDCPIKVMDSQAGQVASRYFNRFEHEPSFAYVPKASIAERNVGTEELSKPKTNSNGAGNEQGEEGEKALNGNVHPTVKSVALMAHLIKLITPPGGVVLDPFAGSGTTLVAAKRIGRSAIGIEREYEYWKIIKARLDNGGAYV